MLAPEEENEAEVRREDQDRINRFARLNAQLHEVRYERTEVKKSLELLDDASTELMMGSGECNVLLLTGEAFFDTSEDDAVTYCEKEVEKLQTLLDEIQSRETFIQKEQGELKQSLYHRFGKSINLEE